VKQLEQAGQLFFGWWMVLALFLILFNTALLSSGLALLIRPDRYHGEFVTEGAGAGPMGTTPRADR
jgi:hypothetical protein